MWLRRATSPEYVRGVAGLEYGIKSNEMTRPRIRPNIRPETRAKSKTSDK